LNGFIEHTRAPIFDYALINTAAFSPETLARYAAEGASPIAADLDRVEALGVRMPLPATSPARKALSATPPAVSPTLY
jgi:hypothetical protein